MCEYKLKEVIISCRNCGKIIHTMVIDEPGYPEPEYYCYDEQCQKRYDDNQRLTT